MIREWNMGKLAKVFIPIGGTLKELPKNEWPKYVDVTQGRPALAHKSGFINILILFVIVLIFCIGAYLFLFYPTSGVHNPIEKDKFIFHKTGELVEYTFNPNLFKDYNVSIVSSKPFPTKEKFNWKIKYELIKDGKINKDGYLKEQTRIYEGKDQKKLKLLILNLLGSSENGQEKLP
jgi:hypothetical protein